MKPVPVLNVDGTRNQEGDITHYVLLTVSVGKHAEKLWCAVVTDRFFFFLSGLRLDYILSYRT